jgi:hydrogenase maturation protease
MVVVVGIGQTLRGDDEAGLAAVRLWRDTYASADLKPGVRVELAESPGIGLLGILEGAGAALLVDAVQSGAKPGRLHFLSEADLAAFLEGATTAHGWGVAETLALGRKINPGSLPERIVLIGIETGEVGLGRGLSEAVKTALPQAAGLIQAALEMLLSS